MLFGRGVAAVDGKQAVQQQVLIQDDIGAAMRHDGGGKPAAGNDGGDVAELLPVTADEAIDHAGGAQHHAGKHAVHGVGADGFDFAGTEADGGQQRGRAGQRLQRDFDAGEDGAADKAAVLGDDGDFGSGAQIDDDGWQGVFFRRAHSGTGQVRTQGSGFIDTDIKAGFDPGANHNGGDMAIAEDADGIVEYGGERRYDRGDGRAGKLGRFELMQAEDLREKDGVFRFGTQGVRLGAGGKEGVFTLVDTKADIGVADINGEDHRVNLLSAGQQGGKTVGGGLHKVALKQLDGTGIHQ